MKTRDCLDVGILVAFVFLIFSSLVNSSQNNVDLSKILLHFSWEHPLGTDFLGRDLFQRVAQAISYSVLPTWLAVILGTMGGHFVSLCLLPHCENRPMGKIVAVFYFLFSSILTIPVGLLVFMVSLWFDGAGLIPFQLLIVLLFLMQTVILDRSLYQRDHQLAYWQAHQVMGGHPMGRIFNYGMSHHWRSQIIANLVFNLQCALILETTVSYLGFGIQEPLPSFGNMLASHYDAYFRGEWRSLVVISLALLGCLWAPAVLQRRLGEKKTKVPNGSAFVYSWRLMKRGVEK